MEEKLEKWKAILSECLESKLSQWQFCKERGINVSTLNYWKRRMKQTVATAFSGRGLVRVPVQLPPRTIQIVIEVDSRFRLTVPEGVSTESLRRVLEAFR